jgi:hypothetical protein
MQMVQYKETISVQVTQLAMIEFLTAENVPPVDIHQQIKVVNGDSCVAITTV